MSNKKATKRIDEIFAKLTTGEAKLDNVYNVRSDIEQWLEKIYYGSDKSNRNIVYLARGRTFFRHYCLENYEYRENAVLLYKNKFLIEFDINGDHVVHCVNYSENFTEFNIKRFIFAPTKKQIAAATKRTQALIDQYETECQEEYERRCEQELLMHLELAEESRQLELEKILEVQSKTLSSKFTNMMSKAMQRIKEFVARRFMHAGNC